MHKLNYGGENGFEVNPGRENWVTDGVPVGVLGSIDPSLHSIPNQAPYIPADPESNAVKRNICSPDKIRHVGIAVSLRVNLADALDRKMNPINPKTGLLVGEIITKRKEQHQTPSAIELYRKWPNWLRNVVSKLRDAVDQGYAPTEVPARVEKSLPLTKLTVADGLGDETPMPAFYDPADNNIIVDPDFLKSSTVFDIEMYRAMVDQVSGGRFVEKTDSKDKKVTRVGVGFSDYELASGGAELLNEAVGQHLAVAMVTGRFGDFDPSNWPSGIMEAYIGDQIQDLAQYEELKLLAHVIKISEGVIDPATIIKARFSDVDKNGGSFRLRSMFAQFDELFIDDNPIMRLEVLFDQISQLRQQKHQKAKETVALDKIFKPEQPGVTLTMKELESEIFSRITLVGYDSKTEKPVYKIDIDDLKEGYYKRKYGDDVRIIEKSDTPSKERDLQTHDGDTMEKLPAIIRPKSSSIDLPRAARTKHPVNVGIDKFINAMTKLTRFLDRMTTPPHSS